MAKQKVIKKRNVVQNKRRSIRNLLSLPSLPPPPLSFLHHTTPHHAISPVHRASRKMCRTGCTLCGCIPPTSQWINYILFNLKDRDLNVTAITSCRTSFVISSFISLVTSLYVFMYNSLVRVILYGAEYSVLRTVDQTRTVCTRCILLE